MKQGGCSFFKILGTPKIADAIRDRKSVFAINLRSKIIPNSELIHNVSLQFVPVKYLKRRINVIITAVPTVGVVAVFP